MNDEEIRRLFERDDARPPRPGYWEEIQARLDGVDAELSATLPVAGPADAPTTVMASVPAPADENPDVTDTDVVPLRPSTMNINDYPRKTQRTIFVAAAAVLLVAVVGVGLLLASSGDDDSSGVASDDTSEPTIDTDGTTETSDSTTATTAGDDSTTSATTDSQETTASTTATTVDETTATTEPGLVNEAEAGLRFDFGIVERMEEVDGTVWIWFDRVSFTEEQLAGLDHQVEPRYELASDFHGGENVSTRLRTFPLADDATILLLDPAIAEAVCAGEESNTDPFEAFTVSPGLAEGWQPLTVSLTFDEGGEVTTVRDQTGC